MPSSLTITIRFLDPCPAFHGRCDGEEPEWPPSPLRLFQALLAAAARRWQQPQFDAYVKPALRWLETKYPTIIAPAIQERRSLFRMYVPNNAGDLVTAAWARGNADASIAEHRVEKDIKATRMVTDHRIRYVWNLPDTLSDDEKSFLHVIQSAACSITQLGWGIDMVVGFAEILDQSISDAYIGERWLPVEVGTNSLRIPIEGTLDALIDKHHAFLSRFDQNSFRPVPPLTMFSVQHCRLATDAMTRPFAVFNILTPSAERNQAFDTMRRCRDVAAWLRHTTSDACRDWPFGDTSRFVHGHDESGKQTKGVEADHRFMYLPLPTINSTLKRVESIRRVMIAAPPAFKSRVDWVRRSLLGQDLISLDGKTQGVLNVMPATDWVVKQYTDDSDCWHTVTPVIWPGYDDQDPKKAEALLRKAFLQAGLTSEIVDNIQELEWRNVGFCAGVELANRFARPEKPNGIARHVRVKFKNKIRGPLIIGAGRYRGFGLFAKELD